MILNIRIDHKKADISAIEDSFQEMDRIVEYIKNEYGVNEHLLIKTCNRAEMYIVMENGFNQEDLRFNHPDFVIETNYHALKHLLKLTCGLESMIIGEDQILGQIRDIHNQGLKDGCVGNVLKTAFTKAIHVGQVVRKKTNINKGSVSIGSAAVELAESVHGDLKCKKVLVIGAGQMGTLVAKALAEKKLKAIVVANRTYDRAVRLAKELGGYAIHFDKLDEAMSDADVIISATGAPHLILTYEKVKNAVPNERFPKMVMVDIANPRDIDDKVKELGVRLFNIDDLRGIADKNRRIREAEAENAEKIVEDELELLQMSLKHLEVEPLISSIRNDAEKIRIRETKKALKMLGDLNGREKVVDDLTHVLVDRIFHDIIKNLKIAAENDDEEFIRTVSDIFKREN